MEKMETTMYIGVYRDITPIMENQVEMTMENEMETGFSVVI